MTPKLFNELLGINGQKPLRVPCDAQPAADSRPALQERNAANVTGRNDDGGRNHRDSIAGARQGDDRVRSPALKEHARSNTHNPARGLEPVTRCKFATKEQKRLVGEFGDLNREVRLVAAVATTVGGVILLLIT